MNLTKLEKTRWTGKEVCFYDILDSTNIKAAGLAESYPHGTLVIANQQTLGKGRRGRSWSSEKDTGIYMSMLLKPDMEPSVATGLTLVAALAVASAIEKTTAARPYIKWPNDIVLNGKKICGILTEMRLTSGKIEYIVLGIGINVNNTDFPEELQLIASSLLKETGIEIVREELIEAIWLQFEKYYDVYIEAGDFRLLKKEYEKYLVNKNQQVRVLDPNGEYEGIATGITKTGELLVTTDQGERRVCAGEVSVRGIYGYV